jgi:hypothetical protein
VGALYVLAQDPDADRFTAAQKLWGLIDILDFEFLFTAVADRTGRGGNFLVIKLDQCWPLGRWSATRGKGRHLVRGKIIPYCSPIINFDVRGTCDGGINCELKDGGSNGESGRLPIRGIADWHVINGHCIIPNSFVLSRL